jgi:hypothetical protein
MAINVASIVAIAIAPPIIDTLNTTFGGLSRTTQLY